MLRVLVVDDYQDSAESLAMILQLHGYQVDVAKDGPSGLEAAEVNWPDAVVLDIGLPVMDGFEVAQRIQIKSVGRHRPILIAVSGHGDEATRLRCQAAGFDRHLLKPADPSELVTILGQVSPAQCELSEAV